MDLKNGKTHNEQKIIIQDKNSGWYVSDRTFGDGGLVHLRFTPRRDWADSFDPKSKTHMDVVDSIMRTPYELQLIKFTKTVMVFESEELV